MYHKDKIMRKLLGKATTESTSDTTNLGVTSSPLANAATYRPIVSQSTSYSAGVPIGTIDKSPDGHRAIVAGRHVLKTIKIDGLSITDGVDLRAAITTQPTAKNSTNSVADQLSIKDVKWPAGKADTAIFTACANGKIFQYDLTRLGGGVDGAPLEVIHMREDSRQMNTLDINPHRGTLLLAGSQDGIVRCFDIRAPQRTPSGHLTYRSGHTFKCNADGVRHVKWSPKEGFYFACGTDQGVVMKWDIRQYKAPVLRLNAHDKACATLAWHPDGNHLISGGWDNKCHVWDVSSEADRRQKPKWSLHTPAPVASVAWRPGTWSASAQGKRTAQVAVTYDDSSQARHGINACHIWDLARPTMPFKELNQFDSSPAALLWHDQDLLWTAGHDGLFNQFDIAFAPKVIDRISMSTVAFSSHGDVLMFLDERPQSRRPHRSSVPTDMGPLSPYGTSPTAPMLSISRSDSEDEVAGSFLGTRRGKPRHKRAVTGSRSNASFSTTPPGGPDDPTMALEQSLKATGIFRSQQGMAIGPVPSSAKVNAYHYLSVHYLDTLYEVLPYKKGGQALGSRVGTILEHYARAAENIGHFRLAQTWRILAYAMNLLLTRRAQYHLDLRTGELEKSDKAVRKAKSPWLKAYDSVPEPRPSTELTRSRSEDINAATKSGPLYGSLDRSGLRSLLSEELESTSNVATPIARPINDTEFQHEQYPNVDHQFVPGKKLTPVEEAESFTLGPPVHAFVPSRTRLDSVPLSTASHDSDTKASTDGYDFYDTDSISKAIDVPVPRGQGHDFPSPARSPSSVVRSMVRHDSADSFGQMFSISSGTRTNSGLAPSSDGSVVRKPGIITSAPQEQLARSTSTGEYESRIRGSKITEPPKLHHAVTAPPASLQRTDSNWTDDQDYPQVTQTTADSVDSRKGESHPKPDSFSKSTPKTGSFRPSPFHSFEFSYTTEPEQPKETDYLPWSDDPPYPHPVAWEGDAALRPTPLDPYKLVSRTLAFETKSSALNASAIVLLLGPLVHDREDIIDPFQAAAILRQHHSRLMGMKLFVQASLLRKLCVKGWPGDPLSEWGDNFPSVFTPAQENVVTGFLCSNCRKPREIDRRASSNTQGHNPIWRCERCSTVMAPCAVCNHRDVAEGVECPVVELTRELVHVSSQQDDPTTKVKKSEAQDDQSLLSTWWYCAGCGHGGHASCLSGWHSEMPSTGTTPSDDSNGLYSDGTCPLDGCGHACLPGRHRMQNTITRTEEVSRAVRDLAKHSSRPPSRGGTSSPLHSIHGYPHALDENPPVPTPHTTRSSGRRGGSLESSVHGDGNDVLQSRAVETVRESLGAVGEVRKSMSTIGLGAGGMVSALSSSPGRSGAGVGAGTGAERERRKSVKFAGSVLEERR